MSVKAVIDTNVLVSAFLTKNRDSPTIRVVRAILSERFELVCSRGIMEEYAEVLGRGYLNLPARRVDELIGHIRLVGTARCWESESYASAGRGFAEAAFAVNPHSITSDKSAVT